MNNDKNVVDIQDFKFAKFNLEVDGHDYVLELDHESIRQADKLNVVNKFQEQGNEDNLATMIYLFGIKNHQGMTPNLASKIARSIIEGNEYDWVDVFSLLTDEFILRYKQVFTSKGKKTLTKM